MTQPSSQPEASAVTYRERRPIVGRLYIRGQKGQAILRALQTQGYTCDVRQVYRDIELLKAEWREELLTNPVATRAKELAQIDEVIAECWIKYSAAGRGGGDIKWLAEIRAWAVRKAKLLGLDTKNGPGSSEDNPLFTQAVMPEGEVDLSQLTDDQLEEICGIVEATRTIRGE